MTYQEKKEPVVYLLYHQTTALLVTLLKFQALNANGQMRLLLLHIL